MRQFHRLFASLALVLGLAAFGTAALHADLPKSDKRVVAGKCLSPAASILRREKADDKLWRVVAEKEDLYTNDLLLLLGSDVAIDSKNGAVRLAALGEFTGVSSFPIIETAVVLHDSPDMDLDFTLDRGRVDLTNRKEKGVAKVRIRSHDKHAEFVLTEPGTRLAVEVYGRWPKGTHFKKNPKPDEGPAVAVVLLALKGEIEVDCPGRVCHHLQAPPGRALLIGDSMSDADFTPQRLEKLPEWADGAASEEVKQRKAMATKFRELATTKSVPFAIAEFLHSNNALERQAAVYFMAATDHLDLLAAVLTHVKHPDVWDAGVTAMRHWIGRGPGQDQKLYEGLIAKLQYTPGQATVIVNLLHSFGDEEVQRPELYETLIDYLEDERPGIRGLAHWHLVRLVPAGRKIEFNRLGTKDERAKAVAEWRKLVPSGKLPPKVVPEK